MREPRPYQRESDLVAMCEVLVEGRKANNGTYYVHTGDLKWWLYYPPLEGDYWDHIYLWDDPAQPGRLLGWAIASPVFAGFDVYIQPRLRGSPLAQEMYIWAEEKALQVTRRQGKTTIYVLWVSHDDEELGEHFRSRGYRLGRGLVHLTRTLDEPIPDQQSVGDFVIRNSQGLTEVTSRAKAQYGAFASRAPFERYLQRFENFMRSRAYDCNLDIVAVSADGEIAAFCIVWLDPVNRAGLFEPVGTHPDFQRNGLGKAVMLAGLRYMQAHGMGQAILSTDEDNTSAIRLYEALGFKIVARLGTYEKDV
jgi:mycothiol synthase